MIKSAAKNFYRRQAVRNTWAGTKYVNNTALKTFFLVGYDARGSSIMLNVAKECAQYNDVVVIDMEDTYA